MEEETIIITREELFIIDRCIQYFDNETNIIDASLNLKAHQEKGNQYEIDGFKKLIKRLKKQDKTAKKLAKKINVYFHGEENDNKQGE